MDVAHLRRRLAASLVSAVVGVVMIFVYVSGRASWWTAASGSVFLVVAYLVASDPDRKKTHWRNREWRARDRGGARRAGES